MTSKILFPAFLILCLVQLYVPARIAFDGHTDLAHGTAYKFKTIPVDPTDPLRGKYIALQFEAAAVEIDTTRKWSVGESVYACPAIDGEGFAFIAKISRQMPEANEHYFECEIIDLPTSGESVARLQFPFNRYYMEESKAQRAEDLYRQYSQSADRILYALVFIHEGSATLRELLVDGEPLQELINGIEPM